MVETAPARLKCIEAFLTWSPLPKEPCDWQREPSYSLLTEKQLDRLADLFAHVGTLTDRGVSFTAALQKLSETDVRLLETFLAKSLKGKELLQKRWLPNRRKAAGQRQGDRRAA